MKKLSVVRISALCLALTLSAGAGLLTAEPQIAPTGITWDLTTVAHDGARLVISGPEGFYLARDFGTEEPPALSLFTEEGHPLPDGTYAWEVTTTPRVDPELRKILRELRQRGRDARSAGVQLPKGERHSGYFAVQDSRFVVPSSAGASEAPLTEADSEPGRGITERATAIDELCVGFDCTISLTYNDSNLVLRDAETRLKFADTSTSSPSFSSGDWEIEVNSADSGSAANYFGLNDCGYSSNEGGCASDLVFAVETGARGNALYIEEDGDVGFGTSSPQTELHAVGGNGPTLRLEQDASQSLTPQSWDLTGTETAFYLRDVTNSLTPFQVQTGAASNTLAVTPSFRVGINDLTPSDLLDIDVVPGASINGLNGGITIESTTDGASPQLTLIEPTRSWRVRVTDGGHLIMADVQGGGAPLRIHAGTDNSLLYLIGSVAEINGDATISGDLTVSGVKSFVQAHPDDPARSFYYAALEGPEAGTYFRGTAKTVDGRAVIELPEVFSAITEKEGLTVQITPVGGDHRFYVEERSPSRLIIREPTAKAEAEFDFFVQGVRLGYADYVVDRPTPAN